MMLSVFWAIPYIMPTEVDPEPEPGTEPYNIYVDAKNGLNTNSGLFEVLPVQTINQAGIVMSGLPSDREIRGVNIYMWGSTLGDSATIYRDYNDTDSNIGAPKSSFIGMNNYRITKNPNPLNTTNPILDGGDYLKTDARRVALNIPARPAFLYLEGNNITVDNLEMTNIAGNAIRHRGNNAKFRWLHIHDTNSEGIDSSGNDNLFELLHIHGINENISQGREGDAIQIQNSERPVIRLCVAHTISGTAYNFSNNVNYGLMYLNDAWECGFPNGLAGAVPTNATGIGYRVTGTDAVQSIKNAAIGNRAWNNKNHFQALDRGSPVIMYNSMRGSTGVDFNIKGGNTILIANNVSLDRADLIQYQGPATGSSQASAFPKQRSNNWASSVQSTAGLTLLNGINMGIVTTGTNWKSTVVPAEPHAVNFSGTHYLPTEAKYATVATHDFGFGKHLGPVDAVIEKLRSLTAKEIVDLVKLYT